MALALGFKAPFERLRMGFREQEVILKLQYRHCNNHSFGVFPVFFGRYGRDPNAIPNLVHLV